ncbi:MAG: cytosine permease [Thermoproteota archaeon]
MSEEIRKDVFFTMIPTTEKERPYGMLDFFLVQISFGIAAWFFLVGGFTGLWLPAKYAVPTVIFGNVFPLFLISLLAIPFARYGVDQYIGHRAVFGHKFSDIWVIIYIVSSFGWIAYISLLMGQSAWKIASLFQLERYLGILATEEGYWIWAIIGLVINYFIALGGPTLIKWFLRVVVISLLTLLSYLMYSVIVIHGLDTIYAATPAEPFEDLRFGLASALEINVGLGFSWAFWYGQWTRLARSERAAYHGCQWGWGIIAAIAGVFSAFTALLTGSFDPSVWVYKAGGIIALIGLIMLILSNFDAVCLIYPMSVTLASRLPRIKWPLIVLIPTLGGIILDLLPGVYEKYYMYLAYISLLTGIYGAIVTGNYLITRGRWNLRWLYYKNSPYIYFKGFNLESVIATIVGTVFYFILLEPISWTSPSGLFPYMSAGLPSYFLTLATYIGLAKSKIFNKFYKIDTT